MTLDHEVLSADELRERVRTILPLIASRAADAEARRKPDDDVIEALKQTGVFRVFLPEQYGGLGADLDLFIDIGSMVGGACASTGWITTFYMEHNWLLSFFDETVQKEILTAQQFVLAPGAVNPSGVAVPDGDGYRLSGLWKFGTGVVHADWVFLTARIDGDPVPRTFLLPVDDVEVTDTWHVDGMSATGSRDIRADGVLVPAERSATLAPPPYGDGPYLQQLPLLPFLALTAAIPSIGAARRATELFQQRLRKRVMWLTENRQVESEAAQIRLANLLVRTQGAEVQLRHAASRMDAHARGVAQLAALEQVELRLVIATVVRSCRDIVRDAMEGSGAGAHFMDHELQRIHRDTHMMSAHAVFDIDVVAAQYGREVLAAPRAN